MVEAKVVGEGKVEGVGHVGAAEDVPKQSSCHVQAPTVLPHHALTFCFKPSGLHLSAAMYTIIMAI